MASVTYSAAAAATYVAANAATTKVNESIAVGAVTRVFTGIGSYAGKAVESVGVTTFTGVAACYHLFQGGKLLLKGHNGLARSETIARIEIEALGETQDNAIRAKQAFGAAKLECQAAGDLRQDAHNEVVNAQLKVDEANTILAREQEEQANAKKTQALQTRVKNVYEPNIQLLANAKNQALDPENFAKKQAAELTARIKEAQAKDRRLNVPEASATRKNVYRKKPTTASTAKPAPAPAARPTQRDRDSQDDSSLKQVMSLIHYTGSMDSKYNSSGSGLSRKEEVLRRQIQQKRSAAPAQSPEQIAEKITADKANGVYVKKAQNALSIARKELEAAQTHLIQAAEVETKALLAKDEAGVNRRIAIRRRKAIYGAPGVALATREQAKRDLADGAISLGYGVVESSPLVLAGGSVASATTSVVGGTLANIASVVVPPVAGIVSLVATPIVVQKSLSAGVAMLKKAREASTYKQKFGNALAGTVALGTGIGIVGVAGGAVMSVAAAAGATTAVAAAAGATTAVVALTGAKVATYACKKAFNLSVWAGSAMLSFPVSAVSFVARKIPVHQ